MTRKTSATSSQLNYGIYRPSAYGDTQVYDGQQPARYETLAQAQAALPRLQDEENRSIFWLTVAPPVLTIGGRTC